MATSTPYPAKRVRSPAYPGCDLRTAVSHVLNLFERARQEAIATTAAASYCGHDMKSSTGIRLIAALKQFALVAELTVGRERFIQVTQRSLDILGQENETRMSALRAAALSPTIIRKVWDEYRGILPADNALRVFLIRKLDFNASYVDGFVKILRATLDYAGLAAVTDSKHEQSYDDCVPSSDVRAQEAADDGNSNIEFTPVRELPITLPSLNVATVRLPARMSQLDFDALLGTLSTWKPALVTKSD